MSNEKRIPVDIAAVARHLNLNQRTVNDLLDKGWTCRLEAGTPAAWIEPPSNMPNTVGLKVDGVMRCE